MTRRKLTLTWILVTIVSLISVTLSYFIGYYIVDGIPVKFISTTNLILIVWSIGCSGWVVGTIGGKICNWIIKKLK